MLLRTQRHLLVFACLLFGGRAAVAHHSFAMYDSKQLKTITGTVKSFQWNSPHVVVWLITDAAAGVDGDLWSIEFPTSPGVLSHFGWDSRSLQPGDKVVIEMNPLRDGQHGGRFQRATLLATGKVLVIQPP